MHSGVFLFEWDMYAQGLKEEEEKKGNVEEMLKQQTTEEVLENNA
jgi:hypothetical protein